MTAGPTLRFTSTLAVLMGLALGGCSSTCVSNNQKLAKLAPGMSYDDVTAVMGCQGRVVRGSLGDGDGYAVAEWAGPTSLFRQTDMMFFDRRLLWYDSRTAPGF
jgi:hypothetical protein